MQIRDDPGGVVLQQVQGNISPGFRKDVQELLFVRFPDPASGRAWIGALYPDITSGWEVATYNRLYYALRHPPAFAAWEDGWQAEVRPERRDLARILRSTWKNVAFTAAGLTGLGLNPWDLGFSLAFTKGLLNRTTAPEYQFLYGPKDGWEIRDSSRRDLEGANDDSPITHAILIVGADTVTDLELELMRQYRLLALHRVDLVANCRGQTLGDGRVHFGFRDGMSQPDPPDPLSGWMPDGAAFAQEQDAAFAREQIVAPGEFILGCPNESAQDPPEPEWARYGSYLAFVKLEQDVATFNQVMEDQAAALDEQGVEMTPGLLRAKAIGRWPSGLPVRPGDRDDPARNGRPDDEAMRILTSDFTDDPAGDGCPLFSHVRKTNPRGYVGGSGTVDVRRHRIIRRGLPYGPPYVEGADDAAGDRGILFLAYQANIEQQFEHIARRWASNPAFPSPPAVAAGFDPVIGTTSEDHAAEHAAFGVNYHRNGAGIEAAEDFAPALLERFIKTKGGGYFFAPSIPALKALDEGHI